MNEYEVRVTRQALEQMKEIVHYISNDLMALVVMHVTYMGWKYVY